jgi:thioredoxin 1
MSPISPFAGKVIVVAALLIAGGLLVTCPSRGQCPFVQLLRGRSHAPDAIEPSSAMEPAEGESATAETESADAGVGRNPAVTQPDRDVPAEQGDDMPTLEPKPRPVGEILHADLENFEQMVLESEIPVLVDFYADWCRPCQILAPTLDELARETPNARIVKVNVDENPELAGHFGVSSIPALMVFKDGNLVAKRLGVADKASLKRLLGS